jgi:hypothetical protein
MSLVIPQNSSADNGVHPGATGIVNDIAGNYDGSTRPGASKFSI